MNLYHGGTARGPGADREIIFDHADYSQYDQMLQEGVKSSMWNFPLQIAGSRHGIRSGPSRACKFAILFHLRKRKPSGKKMMAVRSLRMHGTPLGQAGRCDSTTPKSFTICSTIRKCLGKDFHGR